MAVASKSANRPRQVYDPDERYTLAEIAEREKTTVKAINHQIEDGKFPRGGIFTALRQKRVWGWAVNQWLADRSE